MGPGQPWQVLPALPAWQVTQLPRPFSHHGDGDPGGGLPDDGTAPRAQELVSAYCRSAPVAVAWIREHAGGPVRVITAGPGIAAGRDDGQDVLTFPSGARGQRLQAAAPAVAASPGPVIGRRSVTCGPDCAASACTLSQIRAAQRVTVTDPRITLWAELAVRGHLTRWAMPAPGCPFGRDLRAMPARLRDCALSQADDAAVAARAAAATTRVSPGALAVHVTDAMRHAATEGTWLCERAEPQYLAPPYRWALVQDILQQACHDGGHSGRHPHSRDWERGYGQPVPGRDCAAQLAAVRRRLDRDLRWPRIYLRSVPSETGKPAP